MTTRIQELLLRFNIPPSNETAVNYLTKYVNKGELSEENSCNLLALSRDTLKQNEWCPQNADLTDFIDERFLLKKNTSETETSSSSSSAKGKYTPETLTSNSSSSGKGKYTYETETSSSSSSGKGKKLVESCSTPFNEDERFGNVPPSDPVTKDYLVNSIGHLSGVFSDAENDLGWKMVVEQLEFLLERKGSPRPPLPTNRPPTLTDIVYLKRSELWDIIKLYIKLGRNLADVGSDKTFEIVQKNRGLHVFSHYMCEIFWGMISDEDNCAIQKMIESGFRALMDVVRKHNNDIVKVVQYVSSLDSLHLPDNISGVSKNVFVMILQAIIEYSPLLENEDGIQRLVEYFGFNPLYTALCRTFSRIY